MKGLFSVNISKGFAKWVEMSDAITADAEAVGVKVDWAGCSPDETKVFIILDMKDADQMKTFGEREDIAKAREDAGVDVSSTTLISMIGEVYP
jgi:hypothetical protein|tara:strand:- start:68 stop:346 length:279 start_codon:yes stop_codon:yes gene_type:complete